ncbi:MAG: BlaI/MecI/CopY family transcriptional regulator [Christensenellaceae bacterium]|nr:BlaI/MecI/CopY family transcriptional regulator [Christensenellaceae bacterium]
MSLKLYDSELKIMDVLWRRGDTPAREIASELKQTVGWNVNTTYTLIKRCIAKEAIKRQEPGFVCCALVSQETVQQEETQELIDRVFAGSADKLFAALVGGRQVSAETLRRLRDMLSDMEDDA